MVFNCYKHCHLRCGALCLLRFALALTLFAFILPCYLFCASLPELHLKLMASALLPALAARSPAVSDADAAAAAATAAAAAGKKYFGRGPMQLSWNYNVSHQR
jgi:hypothetical protein